MEVTDLGLVLQFGLGCFLTSYQHVDPVRIKVVLLTEVVQMISTAGKILIINNLFYKY